MRKIVAAFLVTALVLWVYAGWPPIWQNPRIPAAPKEAHANSIAFTSTGSWQAPAGVTSVTVEAWGSGGGGGGKAANGSAGGGGGGAYAEGVVTVTPGNTYSYTIGAVGTGGSGAVDGNDGGDTYWDTGSAVLAKGGKGGKTAGTGGAGGLGSASVGTTKYNGGTGGSGSGTSFSGGGGGGASYSSDGNSASGQTAGAANNDGGAGGAGIAAQGNGGAGTVFGGAGAGALRTSSGTRVGGAGAAGQIRISYSVTATPSMQEGYYIGDGTTSHTISGLGFKPDFVLIKADTTAGAAAFKTSLMPDANMAFVTATADNTASNLSLSSDGFTVGNQASVNSSGVRYTWMAFAGSDCASGGEFCIGQYTGNAASSRTVPTGFSPDFVLVKRTTAVAAHFHTTSEPDNETLYAINLVRDQTGNFIKTFTPSGFTVGATDNAVGGVYNYIVFKDTANFFAEGTYAGNAADNTEIAVSFQPDAVIVKNATNATANNTNPVWNSLKSDGDDASVLTATASAANYVQALDSTGFQVGTSVFVNGSGDTYYWFAWKGVPAPAGTSGSFDMAVGTYTGSGTAQSISGLDFAPDLVMIKDVASTTYEVFRTSLMRGDATAYLSAATANFAGGITSLDAAGFSVGTNATVNGISDTYYYEAFGNAWSPETKSGASDFSIGVYNGNSGDSREITGVPFQPDLVAVKANRASAGTWRSSALSGDLSSFFSNLAEAANFIQSLNTDGFEVGTNAAVNTNATLNYWFGFKTGTNFAVGTYTGNGSTQNITAPAFSPDLVWTKRSTTVNGVSRDSSMAGDNTAYFANLTHVTARITALISTGFTVGNNTETNTNAGIYRYAAWRVPVATVVSVTVADGAVNYGTLSTSNTVDTTSGGLHDTQTVTNNGNVPEDFTIQGQNTGCPWTLASSPGSNQYQEDFSTNAGGNWTPLTTSYQSLASNVSASGSANLDLRLLTPTVTTCNTAQSVDVTILAAAH